MRTPEEIEASREESRRWYRSVQDELAPVVEAYRALPMHTLAAGTELTIEQARGSVEDYGVGPLLTVTAPHYDVERADGSYHYVYAFVASPIINDSVQAVSQWTVGIDYSDGQVLVLDLPVGTSPEVLARSLFGLVHVMTATYDAHYETPRPRLPRPVTS
jgi:hypothetical protein